MPPEQLNAWNVVCVAPGVKPSAFDVDGFAEGLEPGEQLQSVVMPELSIVEWEKIRLQIFPEKLQLGFAEKNAPGAFVRNATERFFSRIDEVAPAAPLGINAGFVIKRGDDEPDPSQGLFNAAEVAASLDGEAGRGGAHLVYHDDASRWWIELRPAPEDEKTWIFDFNRQFSRVPPAGAGRDDLLDWFSDMEARVNALYEAVKAGGGK